MKKILLLALLLILVFPLMAVTEGEWTFSSGWNIYGLMDNPYFLHSVPVSIGNEKYFNNTLFGIASEFNAYIPLFYMHGNLKSPDDAFTNYLYMDYALAAAVKWRSSHIDLFADIGWFVSLRFLYFSESRGLQLMLNSGPRMKIGMDMHLTDIFSLRLSCDGSLYVFRNDMLRPKSSRVGMFAMSITPELGFVVHFSDDWDFGRMWGRH